jgi:putative peptide zinc metalloprotease protein
VQYDVTFALVWVDGDTAVNRNEAFALASCTSCTTVAVAFQVVLLVGSVDVVVPQNAAVAVNYACVECVTQALATQLVLSLDGPLDPGAQDALAALWTELQAFAADVPGLPLAEIRDRLTAYEARIVEVVRDSAEPATGEGTSTSTDAGGGDLPADGDGSEAPVDDTVDDGGGGSAGSATGSSGTDEDGGGEAPTTAGSTAGGSTSAPDPSPSSSAAPTSSEPEPDPEPTADAPAPASGTG